MKEIDKSTRVLNYIVDISIIFFLSIIATIILPNSNSSLILYLIMFCYYFIAELSFQKTIGKLLTKTKVTNKKGNKPSIFKVFIRSLMRLIPIDAISYLFGSEYGLHDVVSLTRLSKDN